MKYGNELKVGTAILVSIVIFILGVRFFEDLPLFEGTYPLHTRFDNAGGLINGNAVRVSGVRVGAVDDVELDPETGLVRVDFHVTESIAIPEGSRTKVSGVEALGSVYIDIVLGPTTNASVAPGTFLPSSGSSDLLGDLQERAPRIADQLEGVLNNTDGVLVELEDLLQGTDGEVRTTLTAFRGTAQTLDRLLRDERSRLNSLFASLERTSGSLNDFTNENADSLSLVLHNMNVVLARMNATLASLDGSLNSLDAVMARIEGGQGTLGLLINDPGLYNRLDSTLANLNRILVDFQKRPERYLKELNLIEVF